MEKNKRRMKVYLGKRKQPWVEHCKRLGKKPGVALVELIDEILCNSNSANLPEPKPVEKRTARIELRLTQSEIEAAKKRVELEDCRSVNEWIGKKVRIVMEKQLRNEALELNRVDESNHELKMIGRELNQIARSLNQNPFQKVDPSIIDIKSIREKIDQHIKQVNKAIKESIERWSC